MLFLPPSQVELELSVLFVGLGNSVLEPPPQQEGKTVSKHPPDNIYWELLALQRLSLSSAPDEDRHYCSGKQFQVRVRLPHKNWEIENST